MTSFSPREIVSELDRHIVGQNDAKRAVAVALRGVELEDRARDVVRPLVATTRVGVGVAAVGRGAGGRRCEIRRRARDDDDAATRGAAHERRRARDATRRERRGRRRERGRRHDDEGAWGGRASTK